MEGQHAEAHRALILDDRPIVADMIELTLNHGLFVVQQVIQPVKIDAGAAGVAVKITTVPLS